MRALLACLSFLLLSPFAAAAQQQVALEQSTAELIAEKKSLAMGEAFHAAVRITLPPGWHTYAENPGDAGIPPELKWRLAPGFQAGPILFPPHRVFKEGPLTTYGYDGEVIFPVRVEVPADVTQGAEYTLAVKAEYLVCHDICIPQTAELALTLPGGNGEDSEEAPAIRETLAQIQGAGAPPMAAPKGEPPATLGLALLLAFAGGLILNLMPCVFPVLSLKALAIARYGTQERATAKKEGIAYTLGVLACFLGIAMLLIGLRQAGSAVGWGYQMQSPGFVGLLALLLFALGLNLSGLFELPVLFARTAASLPNHKLHGHSIQGSFLTGALAALVATPCTAPFMASAIGYALTLPAGSALLIFSALALGMALPFLLLSFFPKLLSFLPKPGAWMETFRQLLAFPMYATVIWLVWVLAAQVGPHGVAIALALMLSFIFALWMKRLFRPESKTYRALAAMLVFLAAFAGAQGLERLALTHAEETYGEAFSLETLGRLRAQNTPVFVDATAAWCITCKINERTSLKADSVRAAFAQKNVTLLVADWTNRNPEITQYLATFGRSGVPLYVYYPPGGEPVVLPQLLTPGIVLDAVGADSISQ